MAPEPVRRKINRHHLPNLVTNFAPQSLKRVPINFESPSSPRSGQIPLSFITAAFVPIHPFGPRLYRAVYLVPHYVTQSLPTLTDTDTLPVLLGVLCLHRLILQFWNLPTRILISYNCLTSVYPNEKTFESIVACGTNVQYFRLIQVKKNLEEISDHSVYD